MAPSAHRTAWCTASTCQRATPMQRAEKHLLMALHAMSSPRNPETVCAVMQAGVRAVVNAVGRMVQRGVLPSLRRLSLGGGDLEAGARVPRPDAAPQVEVAALPAGRRPPGQHFWVADDVLPDLHVALGIRAGYDWERRCAIKENVSYFS